MYVSQINYYDYQDVTLYKILKSYFKSYDNNVVNDSDLPIFIDCIKAACQTLSKINVFVQSKISLDMHITTAIDTSKKDNTITIEVYTQSLDKKNQEHVFVILLKHVIDFIKQNKGMTV